jgi:hypothetical protein
MRLPWRMPLSSGMGYSTLNNRSCISLQSPPDKLSDISGGVIELLMCKFCDSSVIEDS